MRASPLLALCILLSACDPPIAAPDGGPPPTDGGAPEDAGLAEPDAGDPVVDAGVPLPDAGAPAVDAGPPRPDAGVELGARYDEVTHKSSHNSYQRIEVLFDQLVYHRARSIELDIHRDGPSRPATAGDWWVFHDDGDLETKCDTLLECLAEVRAFNLAVPEHEVVTVWMDVKEPFAAGHRPIDLDGVLRAGLGDALFEPGELRERCGAATNKAAIAACGWPALSSLRGRVMIVLTDGDLCAADQKLGEYVLTGEAAFVGPQVSSSCTPADLSARDEVIFHNLAFADRALAEEVHAAGLVTRVFLINDEGDWDATRAFDVHHIATDKVSIHRDLWATTLSGQGFPSTCRQPGCDIATQEAGRALGVEVNSEDIFGTGDNFVFLHEDGGDGQWSAAVSVANGHVDEFAKGCLMAREALTPGSRYFAVCRPADNHPIRVQMRTQPGASTDEVFLTTERPESTAFMRLTTSAGGTCAEAEVSFDGVGFRSLGQTCFDAPLLLQGVAASAHGDATVRMLFLNLEREGGARAAADLTTSSIGTVRSSSSFAGYVP